MANPMKLVKAVKKATQSSIAQKKNYKEKVTTPRKKVVKAAKQEAKANKRGLKAANKPRGLYYSDAKGKIRKSKNIKLDKEISDLDAYMKASEQYSLKTGSDKIIAGTANNLKYTPAARPNRVRGGSMGSKLNWPKGMK
jgi:hypothetical protein